MKMAVFLKENALRVNHFLDGGDLEENGCFPEGKRVAR